MPARFSLVAVLIGTVASAAAAQAPAQASLTQAADSRVAFFSPQRAFVESAAGKAARTKLLSMQAEKAKEIELRNRRLQAEKDALQQTAPVLDAAARLQREQEIERFQVDLQRFTEDAQSEFLGVQKAVENSFLERLRPALEFVAKEKRLAFVLDGDAGPLLWADPALDITAEVVARLDKP